ncbi:MAG: PstS family phosphate ABC transporter substrate-binding protein [Clostridia bacterium]
MKKLIAILLAIAVMVGIIIGCVLWYKSATTTPITEEPTEVNALPLFTLEDYPKVDASLAIHPLVNSIAADFLGMDESELNFEYTTTRSSEVYHNLIDGKVDVIFASEISQEDKEYANEKGVQLNIIPATSSAFVFIVNTENPVDGLTFEEIQKIYTGEITSWAEVGGEDAPIIPYQRPTGSGSQTAMLSLVMKDKLIIEPPTSQVQGEMGELIDAVAEYDNAKNAIGYSYFYYVNTMYKRDTIKMLAVDGVNPTIETIKSGQYPIYTNGFIVTRADADENTLKWVDAVLSSRGSKIIEDAGYVPVN